MEIKQEIFLLNLKVKTTEINGIKPFICQLFHFAMIPFLAFDLKKSWFTVFTSSKLLKVRPLRKWRIDRKDDKDVLLQCLQDIWNTLFLDILTNLVASLPNRCRELIKTRAT